MAAQKILLPYNFTESDRLALQFAVQNFAGRPETEITLFHAYTPLPSLEVSGSSITGKLQESFSYLNQKIAELENALNTVRAELVQHGFSENQVKSIFKPRKKDIAGEILGLFNDTHFDIVILSRKPGRVARFFSGSVHAKVLSTMRNTVLCIVS